MNALLRHTPGDWIAQRDPTSISGNEWVIGVEGKAIDHVAVCSERDAPLIAAAPKLFAELHALRGRFYSACVHSGSDPEHALAACSNADAVLREAIEGKP